MNNQGRFKRPYLVITRPEPGLSETARKISTLGWLPILMPVMTIQSLSTKSYDISTVQALLFTSRQAVLPTIQQLHNQKIAYRKIPVFAVGDITAEDARRAGFLNVLSAGKNAAALATLLQEHLNPHEGSLLFPCAQGQGQLLIALLKQAGFTILHNEIYKAVPVKKLTDEFLLQLRLQKINSILFFSSETARFFADLIPKNLQGCLKSIQAVGISIKTKGVLEQLPWYSIDIADHPSTEEMLLLIKEHS